jgi:hypothetical protein
MSASQVRLKLAAQEPAARESAGWEPREWKPQAWGAVAQVL